MFGTHDGSYKKLLVNKILTVSKCGHHSFMQVDIAASFCAVFFCFVVLTLGGLMNPDLWKFCYLTRMVPVVMDRGAVGGNSGVSRVSNDQVMTRWSS